MRQPSGSRLLAAVGICLFIAACNPVTRSYGYTPNEFDLAELKVGEDTRQSVAEAVGTPQTAGLENEDTWYYFSSLFKTSGAFTPKELERQIVAITFTEDGELANIERFGLENGQVITLSRRVTNPAVQNSTFVRQLFDALGNIPTEDIL
ncbi:MAG: outer membrane protein assembly factor BamE [Pseudomonadota bacterium]